MSIETKKLFECNGVKYEIEFRSLPTFTTRGERRRDKGRAYVWGGDDVSEDNLEVVAKEVGAPHIYTSRGDYPELDRAWDKFNREIIRNKAAILRAGVMALGLQSDVADKAKFSRKAGCACGCSPGFILQMRGDIYIEGVKPPKEKVREAVEDPSTAASTLV